MLAFAMPNEPGTSGWLPVETLLLTLTLACCGWAALREWRITHSSNAFERRSARAWAREQLGVSRWQMSLDSRSTALGAFAHVLVAATIFAIALVPDIDVRVGPLASA